jgi:DNA-binding protein H-NS
MIMATLEAIQNKINRLQKQAEALSAKQSTVALDRIRELMQKHGLTTADIDAHLGGKRRNSKAASAEGGDRNLKGSKPQGKLPPKYRDPKTGATWSGHGRLPGWIAGVKDRAKFLIHSLGTEPEAAPARKTKAAAKPAKSAAKSATKGKLPPKYRNPETGETWSGHARPPAWIKNVKDRSQFLIAPVAAGAKTESDTASAKRSAVKKAGLKKATAKKVASKKAVAKKAVAKKAVAKKAVRAKTAAKKAPAKKVAAKKRATAASKKAAANPAPVAEAVLAATPAAAESAAGSAAGK